MARHNTHRAAGRAATPLNPQLALRGVGGAAVLSTIVVGSFGTAQAAQIPTAATAPAHLPATVPTQAPSTAPQVTSTVLSPGSVLGWGDTGSRVKELQSALNSHGANLVVDGIFGRRTNAAVISYQKANGLMVDGRVGRETRGSLNASAATSAPKKSSDSGRSNDKGSDKSKDRDRSKGHDQDKGSDKSKGDNGDGDDNRQGSGAGRGSSRADASSILDTARSQIGVRYVWGGESPSGFDCSGFTKWVYERNGISLPHSSYAQASGGTRISRSEARPGDLVAWPGHVGIYAGHGRVIDAGMTPHRVTERSIWGNPTFITYRH